MNEATYLLDALQTLWKDKQRLGWDNISFQWLSILIVSFDFEKKKAL